MKKSMIATGLALIMSFSLVSCGENDELLERIEELSTKIQAQEKSVEDLQEENQSLKEANEALQEKNEDLTERLTEIEWTYNAPYGGIYSLTEMYEDNFIDKQALMTMAYYLNGGKARNEEIMADFEPTPLEPLSVEMERRIRETFAYWGRSLGEDLNYPETWENYTIYNYFGQYAFNGGYFYAVIINVPYSDYPAAFEEKIIDGVTFVYPSGGMNIQLYFERRAE